MKRAVDFALSTALLASAFLTGCSKAPSWVEKDFTQFTDNEIEASMNLAKQVFDDVLGKDLPGYYQTESTMILRKSGISATPMTCGNSPRRSWAFRARTPPTE